jgi:hypothetical protein
MPVRSPRSFWEADARSHAGCPTLRRRSGQALHGLARTFNVCASLRSQSVSFLTQKGLLALLLPS